MDELTECVVKVAAAVATGSRSSLDGPLDAAAVLAKGQGQNVVDAVDEVLLQSILFVGYPVGLEALAAWRRRVPASPVPTEEDPSLWAQRGERVCQAVYGSQYGRLRDNIRALHPDAERWMISDGYGRVLGRPGLKLSVREVAIVAQLAVLGAHRQLFSHALGALRVGATPAMIAQALEIAAQWIAPDAKDAVNSIWTEVQKKASASAIYPATTES